MHISLESPPDELPLNSQSLSFIEQKYQEYLADPHSVPESWQRFFESWATGGNGRSGARPTIDRTAIARMGRGPSFDTGSLFNPPGAPAARASSRSVAPRLLTDDLDAERLQDRVDQLIRNYRVRGHLIAQIDPLGHKLPYMPELEPAWFGFTEADLKREFSTTGIQGPEVQTLGRIVERMRNTYCRSIGVQYMHIDDLAIREWLQRRMEATENRIDLSRETQLRILTRLTDAVVFEEFIQKKFLGAKSFSLEGAESLIPLLDLSIEKAGRQGVEEIVLGMAHRGRLNVLANIIGKNPRKIFREFEDKDPELHVGRGDVKYHLGFSKDWTTQSGHSVHLSLCFNPSHLEYVNPVALGRMRAKQDRYGDARRERGLVILIHGDAAFAGEGIVQETLNLSELPGYTVGGAIHIVVNNQIGFTTGPEQARSTGYATSVAKMLASPIFHVNGEDPEAVAQVVNVAMDFRRAFHRDVVIDMFCFRRLGHNESDEPAFTQPMMYRAIERRGPVRESYRDHLLKLGGVTFEEAERIADERRDYLAQELEVARRDDYSHHVDALAGVWQGYEGGMERRVPDPDTGVPKDRLAKLLRRLTRLPDGFRPHPKIERGLELRREMAAGTRPVDWSAAEALAFASLLTEGLRIRLSGQDAERGTFSHRHAVLHDHQNGATFTPLAHIAEDQAPVEIVNSPLSEAGVLGFDYGYSLDCPDGLTLWEAQFGDFVNAAQVIIDQFIASAEDKWRRLSGITMLLPHGFEGQGPEHSSARLERFLMLCAEDNMQVVQPSTPAQYFHLLRRQVLRPWRKPLIVMTPKSLLRHKDVVSSLDELAAGRFRRVLRDVRPDGSRSSQVRRVLICSGKIYYELAEEREKLGRQDVAILRLEEYYPLPLDELQGALAAYPDGTPVTWVQEEPENAGAWRFLRCELGESLFDRLPFNGIYRPASASPATGSASSHRLEQQHLLDAAFGKGYRSLRSDD
jgi:2-oxoglutarate dehydrogenase E1 component